MSRQEKRFMPQPQSVHNKLQNFLQNNVLLKNRDFTFEQEKPFSAINFSVQHAENQRLQQKNNAMKQYDLMVKANYEKMMQVLRNAQPSKIPQNKPLYNSQVKQNQKRNYFDQSFLRMFMMPNYCMQIGRFDNNQRGNICFSNPPISHQQIVNKAFGYSIQTVKKSKQINEQIGGDIVPVICLDEEESQEKSKNQETQKTGDTRAAKALAIEPRQDDPFLIVKAKNPKKYDYSKIYGMSRYKYMKMLREKDEEAKRQQKYALPSIPEERSPKQFYQLKIQRSKKIKKQQKKKKQVDANEWFPKYPIRVIPKNQQVQESQSQLIHTNIPKLIKQDEFLEKRRKIQAKKNSLLSREFFQTQVRSQDFQEQI